MVKEMKQYFNQTIYNVQKQLSAWKLEAEEAKPYTEKFVHLKKKKNIYCKPGVFKYWCISTTRLPFDYPEKRKSTLKLLGF